MGKGSGRRPMAITQEELRDNWDRIFNKKGEENGDKSNTTDAKKVKRDGQVSSRADSGKMESVCKS